MIQVDARRLTWLVGLWVLLGAGCTEEVPPVALGPAGSARVVFVLPRTLPEGAVARVTASASGSGASVSTDLEGAGAQWRGWLRSLPEAQPYRFRVEAFDAGGTRRFELETDSERLEPYRPGLIILVGQEAAASSSGNTAPSIQAVVGSRAAAEPGGTLRLRALARDAEEEEGLSYTWQAEEGTFEDVQAAAATWKAPGSGGPRKVTLVVRDTQGSATSLTFTLDVTGVGTLSHEEPVVHNRWPTASGLEALSPRTVGLGQEVEVELQGAEDVDSDALTYIWTATCEGSRSESSGARFRFTPSIPAETSACDNCQVTARVEDARGGSTSYSLGLCVKNKPPPALRSPAPQAVSAVPGELVPLSVSAEDPDGGPLTFSWKANTGILGTPVQTGDTNEVPWTALSCVPAGVTPTIEVTVTNSEGLSIRVRHTVSWNGPVCGHPPCVARLERELLTLQADCTTSTPVFIPDGLALNGTGHTLTVVDPVGGHFLGAIVRNRGTSMHVRNLKVRAQGLLKDGPCDGEEGRLRGILLQGASGSVLDSEVLNIRRNQPAPNNPEGTPRGCQEGHAIEVRNRDASVRREVDLRRNLVSGYQKGGILVAGHVGAIVSQNTVTGAGPVGHIAQNGVQLSDGVTGQVMENQLSGHAYTGSSDVASGLLVAGGPYFGIAWVRDAVIRGNTLTGNDVGIYLDQAEADGSAPATSTRIQVTDNTLRNNAVTNGYPYQAGIADLGGGNTIHSNTLTGAGYDSATQPGVTFDVDVVAGPASQVAFLTPPRRVDTGACSERVLVQSQDVKGNLSKSTPATFELTASGAAAQGLTFHADATCAGPAITTVQLSTAEATASFYFKATQPGTVTLTVSRGSVSGSQDQTVTTP
ncbi:right-handed parallel beta-helix repeat-containing protein [Hyalangium gracile]|uniref:right-handed parallel beta-helix repeat-containing protein n=1 Tax=Hyalangium gracile TaxID=394092 RepID=UPI0021E16743|nr:right-handed parallel beta-helix repeat-containing protein [Hyalangium gracile]